MMNWIRSLFQKHNQEHGIPHTVTHQEFLQLQKEHILRHKYYLSERYGRDVGLKATMEDWIENGWAEMFRKTFKVINSKGKTISLG